MGMIYNKEKGLDRFIQNIGFIYFDTFQVYLIGEDKEKTNLAIEKIKTRLHEILPNELKKTSKYPEGYEIIDIDLKNKNPNWYREPLKTIFEIDFHPKKLEIPFFQNVKDQSIILHKLYDRGLNAFIATTKNQFDNIQNKSKRDCFTRIYLK